MDWCSERIEEVELVGIVGGQLAHGLMVSPDLREMRALEAQHEFHEQVGDVCDGLIGEIAWRPQGWPVVGVEHGHQRVLRAAGLRALAF